MIKREQAEYIVDSLPCLFGGRESRVNFVEAQLDAATDDALIAAEADAARLRETVHALEVENHTLRQELNQTTTATADQNAALADIRARITGKRDGALHSSVTELFVDNVVKALREELDIMQDAASAVLPLLRDRFDGTAEEPLVDALEHALGHTFDGKE